MARQRICGVELADFLRRADGGIYGVAFLVGQVEDNPRDGAVKNIFDVPGGIVRCICFVKTTYSPVLSRGVFCTEKQGMKVVSVC